MFTWKILGYVQYYHTHITCTLYQYESYLSLEEEKILWSVSNVTFNQISVSQVNLYTKIMITLEKLNKNLYKSLSGLYCLLQFKNKFSISLKGR